MEKRFLLAIILSAVVLVMWDAFFVPRRKPVDSAPAGEVSPWAIESEADVSRGDATPELDVGPPIQAEELQLLKVETDLVRVLLTNEGGRILSWKLKNYRDKQGEPIELVTREAREQKLLPLSVYHAEDTGLAASINQRTVGVSRRLGGVSSSSWTSSTPRR